MIDQNSIGKLAAKTLNWDVHPSLLESGALIYALNADVQGNEQNANSYFVQNQLSNELCYEFPQGYDLLGRIKLNNSDQVLFFKTDDYDEIGILNTEDCDYNVCVTGTCLNFNSQIRGVYKFNNSENDRRIYFIDGENPNRYYDVDKPFPTGYTGSVCESCTVQSNGILDCNALNIVKDFTPPCVEITQNDSGQLLSGVYQVGVAYGIDDLVLTDYYFSPSVKAFSERANIGFNVEISCNDSNFEQISVILVTNTRENSLVVYNIGFFPISSQNLTITNLDNLTILSTQQALQKRTIFDKSQHIASNGETLLIGKHRAQELLNYQPQANNIEVEWVEIRVPKTQAHKYPSFMRDENYAIGIKWFGTKGNNRGEFHIPGRAPTEYDLETADGDPFNKIQHGAMCDAENLRWQVYNTAEITSPSVSADCIDPCFGLAEDKSGIMGYWESKDYTYPNDPDVWGDLVCEPIRHHKMPSHNLTHIHNGFTTLEIPATEDDCYEIEVTGGTIEYCPSGVNQIVEDDCINILTIRLKNIEHPKKADLNYDEDISGYQILVGDRQGNKSILHKGLLYNVRKDTSTAGTEIFYPNYPFNDRYPDYYLTTYDITTAHEFYDDGGLLSPSLPVQDTVFTQFTYHSPDIHYRETKQEFGTELTVYGTETGWIEGKFNNVYQHPKTRLGKGSIQDKPYTNHAAQINMVAHYLNYGGLCFGEGSRSRYKIETSQYLLPVNQILSNGKKFNNFLRETSYYIDLGDDSNQIFETLGSCTPVDHSRPLLSNLQRHRSQKLFGDPNTFKTNSLPFTFDYFDNPSPWNSLLPNDEQPDVRVQAVSPICAIKIYNPNQYKGLEQISYRPVGCFVSVEFNVEDEEIFYESEPTFGGDIFISKHSLLRKMPMFTEWLTDVSIETENDYRQFRNIWYPSTWYDNLTLVNDLYSLDNSERTLHTGDCCTDYTDEGKFYIFVTGVIDFWCESEFIGNYREQDFTINGQYYPKVDYSDIARADKIPYDNKFLYNFVLLNNEIERNFQNLNRTESDADFIVSYSLKNDLQSQNDKWLQFLPLNYTVLPRIHGKFTGMHYTDDYSILFAFENKVLYSQLNFTLNTNEGSSLLLTQGDIFSNRLRPLSNELTGYVGCVDPLSFINTRYGTFFVDRYRKKFFLWNDTLKDVTGNLQSWFNHFLGYDYPEYESSLISVYDNFTDKVYFTGGSGRNKWTISFNPRLEGFNSFHSFTPEFYFTDNNTYLSANDTGIWKHNKEYHYQTYYGQQHRFEVGLIINNNFLNKEIQNIELFAEFIKQTKYGSPIYKQDKFFDRIFAYNNLGSTGLMIAYLKDPENPNDLFIQNSDTNNPLVAEVTRMSESIYRFNKFENIRVDHDNQPLITLDSTGMSYVVNSVNGLTVKPQERGNLKGKWVKLHLRSETNNDHKILLQLSVPNTIDIKE